MPDEPRILTDEMVEAIRALFPRYPTRQAVTLPALHVVNERLRHVPRKAVVEIARLLDLAPAQVQDTLSFYGFFKQDAPHGETRAWVCRSISCALRGGEAILDQMCRQADIRPGETTPDGRLTLEAAECLGGCDFAPCMLAGDTLHKNLTAETAEQFVREAIGEKGESRVESPESSVESPASSVQSPESRGGGGGSGGGWRIDTGRGSSVAGLKGKDACDAGSRWWLNSNRSCWPMSGVTRVTS